MAKADHAAERETYLREAAIAGILGALKPSDAVDCACCGEEIGAARKKAVPEATLCIRCARAAEGNSRK